MSQQEFTAEPEPIDSELNDSPRSAVEASPTNRAEDTTEPSSPERDINDILTVVFSCPVDHSGTTVYVKGWKLAEAVNPQPIVLVHDLGENVGMYRQLARRLARQGFSVYGFDLRGHGRSGRMLGHVRKFDLLINDLLQVVAWVRHKQNGLLPIIIGQGIGSLISTYFHKTYPQYSRANILVAPCFRLLFELSRPRRFLIRTIADMTPKLRLPAAATPKFTSGTHPGRVTIIESLTHQQYPGITANFANELLLAMDRVGSAFRTLNKPTLIIFPEKDVVCDFDAVRELVGMHPEPILFSLRSLAETGHHVFTESDVSMELGISVISEWLSKFSLSSP